VANVATYSLLGVEPIEAVIDKLILIFFGSILQNKDTIEYRIIERQYGLLFFGTVFQTWCEFPKSGCCKVRNFKVDFVCFSSIQASSQ
jgi:hypothetical protein